METGLQDEAGAAPGIRAGTGRRSLQPAVEDDRVGWRVPGARPSRFWAWVRVGVDWKYSRTPGGFWAGQRWALIFLFRRVGTWRAGVMGAHTEGVSRRRKGPARLKGAET